jgi:hypothetical protein
MLGKHDLTEFNEEYSINSSISQIVIHPDWKVDEEKYYADIAIVILTETIKFNDFIRPVCLPKQSYEEVKGAGMAVGWGQSEYFKRHANKPNELAIPIINAKNCLETFPNLALISSGSSFCGGYINESKAPCNGDSGGGLYFNNTKFNSWTVGGIISASLTDSSKQCNINAYQLYTNVAMFVDWIWQYVVTVNSRLEEFEQLVNFDCSEPE